jgi:hypothetical protein
MNPTLSRDLSAAIIADRHALAAQHRLVRMVAWSRLATGRPNRPAAPRRSVASGSAA